MAAVSERHEGGDIRYHSCYPVMVCLFVTLRILVVSGSLLSIPRAPTSANDRIQTAF